MFLRFSLLIASALLFLSRCSEAPTRAGRPAVRAAAPAVPPPQPEPPVAQVLQALLDTTATGRAAATAARLNLQAGPSLWAFYGPAPAPAWMAPAPDSIGPAATTALALLADAAAYGLRPADYGTPRLLALRDSLRRFPAAPGRAARQARLDIGLSDGVLRFMLDLYRGRLRSFARSPREKKSRQTFQPAEALRSALAGGHLKETLLACQPPSREYRQLQAALAQQLHSGPAADSAAQWQQQNEQIALNLERWRWEAVTEPEYVLVNIPAFALQVVRHGQVMQRHRVIVGKPQTPTPTLSSALAYFTTAPDWHVPRSIAVKEILPELRRNAGYLERNNMALYDAKGHLLNPRAINWQRVAAEGFDYSIRQSPGCDNSLGNIVFRFNNPYSIYLHDTPFRQLFGQAGRALSSHGCIRLENPLRLAEYLLRRDGQPVHLPSEAECAHQPQSKDYRLRRAMPFYVRYATCAVESGRVQFYDDPYRRDEALRRALFGPAL